MKIYKLQIKILQQKIAIMLVWKLIGTQIRNPICSSVAMIPLSQSSAVHDSVEMVF